MCMFTHVWQKTAVFRTRHFTGELHQRLINDSRIEEHARETR
jgi:hypothetical protein